MFHLIPMVFGLALSTASASITTDLDQASRSAEELVASAEELDHRIAPGRAYLNNNDAMLRYEESLYQLMIGNHRAAAEGFFGLVATEALQDSDLQADAEWFLSEALFGMGNIVTAESRYRKVVETPDHPFRVLAVRRLLELYAVGNQDERFNALYDAEIVRGRVKASEIVTYAIGKSFYVRGDFDRSAGYFAQLNSGDSHYARSQYFLGVIELRRDNLKGSVPFFETAAASPVSSSADQDVHDLAVIALARLAYEGSDFEAAATLYQKVNGDSSFLSDVFREQVWSFIKQNRYDEALRSAELFLAIFSDHRYSGELRVVRGHLFMGCGQEPARCPDPDFEAGGGDAYERALLAYENIVEDYVPIRDRFGGLAASQDEPEAYFRNVFAAGIPDSSGLPRFAISMMRSDKELNAALVLHERLEEQRADLAESEMIIEELRLLLAGPTSVGGFDASHYQAVVNQARAIREQVELLDLEAAWLANENVSGLDKFDREMSAIQTLSKDAVQEIRYNRQQTSVREDAAGQVRNEIAEVDRELEESLSLLDSVRRALAAPNELNEVERTAIEEHLDTLDTDLSDTKVQLSGLRVRLSQLRMPFASQAVPGKASSGDTPIGELAVAIESLRMSYKAMRPGKSADIAKRFDGLHERLQHAAATYATVLDRIENLADSEIARVRERFAEEVIAVAAQRVELDATADQAEALAVDLTRLGFGRMEDFFADGVLKAEMGIIDVYWARKLEIADQRQRIQDERNALVAELERRFAIIRQKMEQ